MVLVIDPSMAGISGDMLLGALVDLGANPKRVADGVAQSGRFMEGAEVTSVRFERAAKHGISAQRLVLEVKEDARHRQGTEVKEAAMKLAGSLGLSDDARNFARSSVDMLIAAESRVHGVPPESVHFHEASSIDTVADIVGAGIALDDLGIWGEEVYCMPVSVGGGTVMFSHGTMSNPASAILAILEGTGITIQGGPAYCELATPTGACMLASLAKSPASHYPRMAITAVGYGAGTRDLEGVANVLKLVRGARDELGHDTVKVLETNVDDVPGEVLGSMVERLMGRGAKDVSVYPGITKKGRPTNLISVVCAPERADDLAEALILETGTLGIRVTEPSRILVPREERTASVTIRGKGFDVRYKVSSFKGRSDYKVEFDDIKRVSESLAKSVREAEYLLRQEIGRIGG